MEDFTHERFKAIRRGRQLTQGELGIELDLSQPAIAAYEKAGAHVDRRTAYAMLAIEAGLKLPAASC